MYYSKNKTRPSSSRGALCTTCRSSGFTLLEILIALFIFTLLSLMLTGALRGVIDAQEATENKAERLRTLQMALLIMSRDVEQSINRPILSETGKQESAFVGDDKSFSLTRTGYANPNFKFAHSTLERIRYSVDEEGLWRETWEALDLAPAAKSHKRKLLADLKQFYVEYLDGDGRLHTNWPFDRQGEQALPRALQVTITFPKWGKMTQVYLIEAEPSAEQQATPPKS
jgi:general secretion pathway protein J